MNKMENREDHSITVEELSIPVPWGHVAAKAWGDKSDPHVLAFHGILDNAGSFDHLIPKLPFSSYYICVDLPGHGKSSHFPPYMPIHTVDYLMCYKLIAEYFDKGKYIILGHSFGGLIATLFARVYPEFVEKLVLLDTINLWPISTTYFNNYLREKFDNLIRLNEKLANGSQPTYTYEEALERVLNYRFYGELTEKSARSLLNRGLTKAANGKFYFNTDQRLKFFMNPLHDFRYAIETYKKCPIPCPVLIVLGTDSKYQQVYMRPIIKLFERNSRIYIKYVPGHHDVHMNNPDLVAKYINIFFKNKKCKL